MSVWTAAQPAVCFVADRAWNIREGASVNRMKLYLVQHGDAVAKEVDPERPLSDQGRKDVEQVGRFLAEAGICVPVFLHSRKKQRFSWGCLFDS